MNIVSDFRKIHHFVPWLVIITIAEIRSWRIEIINARYIK